MKLEQNDEKLLFSTTKIPDIFFSEYISQASGDFIKVYLYILFLSKYNKDIKINDLSKQLNLDVNTIQEALKFWEVLEVITKKGTGFIINNLQEIELHKLYKPNISLSPEAIERNQKNETRMKLIETINNRYFQGMMSPIWYANIDLWFNQYGFDEAVMLALFNYCFQNSSLHQNYVQAVAENWAKGNVKTFSDLEMYEQNKQKSFQTEKAIKNSLGFRRNFNKFEKDFIKKWTEDYGYSLDIIDLALKKTTSKTTISFDYLDKTITDWHDRGLKTSDDIQNYQIAYNAQKKTSKEQEKKAKYNNFEQRTYNNFDNLYANKQN